MKEKMKKTKGMGLWTIFLPLFPHLDLLELELETRLELEKEEVLEMGVEEILHFQTQHLILMMRKRIKSIKKQFQKENLLELKKLKKKRSLVGMKGWKLTLTLTSMLNSLYPHKHKQVKGLDGLKKGKVIQLKMSQK